MANFVMQSIRYRKAIGNRRNAAAWRLDGFASLAMTRASLRRRTGSGLPGDEHVSARLVGVVGVGRVHGVEQVRCRHPYRRIFVAGDIENEEAIGFFVVGGERRNVTAPLLFERFAVIVDEHEMVLSSEV